MGRWKTPVYLRITKGEDEEGPKKYNIQGAASYPIAMKENTLAIIEIELDIDEEYLDPITHTKAVISMKTKTPDVAIVRSGLKAIDQDIKDLDL